MIDSHVSAVLLCGVLLAIVGERSAQAQSFLPVADLKPQAEMPDPLVLLSGQKVATPQQWERSRKPELKALFQHYMYGFLPPAPAAVDAKLDLEDKNYFGGKATKKQLTLKFGPPGTPPIHLLVLIPNDRRGPVPVFLGLNFCGNHSLLDDPTIPLADTWMPRYCPKCEGNKPTEAARGSKKDDWPLEQTLARGYAVATCYSGDIDPDRNDFSDGVHPHYAKPGEPRGPHDWGSIAAWAWGLSRLADYLVTDRDIDSRRMIVYGHSRMGKTALVAGAFDDRFALVIPHQAGCGGSAPDRKIGAALQNAESVKKINDSFPHWFCGEFKKFNEQVDRLPFDQNCLVALCAPRPVLLTNATDDQWADPDGQFRVLQGADSVYRLLGVSGLAPVAHPETGQLVDSRLGYWIRPGIHASTAADWKVFADYADKNLPAR